MASSFTISEQEIIKRLEFISEHFIAEENRSLILGKKSTTLAECIQIFVTQATFASKFLSSTLAEARGSDSKVYYFTSSAWGNTHSADATDLNFTLLLTTTPSQVSLETIEGKSITFGRSNVEATANAVAVPGIAGILDFMDTIRVVYNLLDYNTYKRFKAKDTSISVNMYRMDTNKKYLTVSGTDSITVLTTIAEKIIPNIEKLDVSKTNLLAIRRVLNLYDILIHGYIAMYIRRIANSTGVSDAQAKQDTEVIDIINKKITDSNNNLYNSETGIPNLQKKLDQRSNEYNKNTLTIDNIDKQLKSLKEDVSIENNNVVSHTRLLKKNSIVYFVFLSIFVVCLFVLFGIISNNRNDINGTFRPKMQIVVTSIFAISVLSIIIMQVVSTNYLTEPFAVGDVYQGNFTEQSNKYLENTIYISLLVATYNRYGDISHAMNKEEYYYSGINHQLNLRKNELIDKYTVDYHVSKVLQYRIYLLLQILIILSVFINIGLYTGFGAVLLIFMMFLILFVLYMYIVNSNNLVHTDATKLYWGQPNMKAY